MGSIMSRAAPSAPIDPTEGDSFLTNLMAATGKGMTSVARALGASPDFLRRQGLPGTKEEADANDAPLMKRAGGKIGNVLGQAAIASPAMLIPGANTYAGAALIGGGTGAAFTEGDAADRAKGAIGGALGGLAGKGLGDLIGWGAPKIAGRLSASRASAQAANVQRDAAAVAAKEAGYVLPPADVNPSFLNEALGGLSGKIKTAQVASARNQGTTNALARNALGMANDAPLSADALQTFRNTAATSGYAPIRQAGEISADASYTRALDSIAGQYQGAARSFPGAAKNPVMDMVEGLRQQKFDAGDALDMVKVLRESADKAYRAGDTGLGKASKAAAGALEDQIERHLKAAGDDVAMTAFRKARQDIAKSYTVQKAINPGTGDVSAQVLARELQKGKPLSGDLRTIAEVGSAFPKAAQALKEAPKATSPLDWMAALMSAGTLGPGGAVTLGARPAARSLLLSKAYQGLLANPETYGASLLESSMPLLGSSAVTRPLPLAGGLLGIQVSQ